MATVSQWDVFGVAIDITATAVTVTRTSASQYTVALNVSWKTHWGTTTNYGMRATSGGKTVEITKYDTESHKSGGPVTLTGTYTIGGNGSATKTVTVTFEAYKTDVSTNKSATKNVNVTVSVPAWTSYKITYNANGGAGAPSAQTKWKGQNLTLSATKPTKTGHSFLGWATSASATTAGYSAGGTYKTDGNATLYAVWKANTYPVTYNANGSDVNSLPSSQTKTYGQTLTLSNNVPTRTDYEFLGWATSASATTAQYKAGGSYTANAPATLYAVWKLAYVKPYVEVVELYRLRSEDSMPSDDGDTIWVRIRWATTYNNPTVVFQWSWVDEDGQHSERYDVGITSSTGYYEWILGDEIGDFDFDLETTYELSITVSDSGGSTTVKRTIPGMAYTVDYLAGGKGAAFGKPAELENTLDIAFKTRLRGGLDYIVLDSGTDLNEIRTPGFYVGKNASENNYTNCPLTSGTFTLEVQSGGESGQVHQILTRCYKTNPTKYERWYYSSSWGEWFGGWLYPTLTSEFEVYASDGVGSRPACRKEGNLVEVRGIVKPVADIAGSTDMHNIMTVPSGYRPNSPIYVICQGSSNCTWLLRVNTDGTVALSRYRNGGTTATASDGTWLPFQVTYIADQ